MEKRVFELCAVDKSTRARRGLLFTAHGTVDTPAFMPVGTQGTVKGVLVDQLLATGTQMILANTYHLTIRPGEDVVADLGELHGFCGWPGPILTDSGGFQIFSLAQLVKITEQGATFRSHVDGSPMELTPERAIAIQEKLGSDIMMVLDHVVRLPNEYAVVEDAMQRSVRWARRCLDAKTRDDRHLFAIVQGGLEPELRKACAEALCGMPFDGYAVGGLSVGEPPEAMYRTLDVTTPLLPNDRPRYLMGVGRPEDLLEGIARGIDMFDCVMPTRNGRNATAFTDNGRLRMRNRIHQRDPRPIEEDCPCPACRRSRGYIRHLFAGGEMLGPILLTIHNITFYQRLMAQAREAIAAGEFADFRAEKLARWQLGEQTEA